jgi:N-terminal domain of cytochrome oxidase-cbb3, FixP
MTDHSEIDQVTGTSTTGHQWDGIKELNTPLPRWWILSFYATIVWAIGYWVVYPAWPLLWSHTTGLLHYSSRADVAVELANLEKIRGEKMAALGATPLAEIEKDPALLALARAGQGGVRRQLRAVPRQRRHRRQRLSELERRRLAVGRQARSDRADHPVRCALGTRQGA